MLWLTLKVQEISEKRPSEPEIELNETDEAAIVHNTIEGYTTDVTETVAKVRPHIVSVTGLTEDREVISSGVVYAVIGNDTWILSCAESVRDNATYLVRFDNGLSADAQLAGHDPLTDTALFLTHPEFEVRPIDLGTASAVTPGEYVIALGARNLHTQSGQACFGIVSLPGMYHRRSEGNLEWIVETMLTDTAILEETSGGPLINLSGQMIGMLSSSFSANFRGAAMAVTVSEVISAAEQLRRTGTISRGYLGTVTRPVSDLELYQKSAMNISLDVNSGLVITEVAEGSPAQEAGLQPNDVILTADEKELADSATLQRMLYEKNPGDQLVMTIQRQNTVSTVTAELR